MKSFSLVLLVASLSISAFAYIDYNTYHSCASTCPCTGDCQTYVNAIQTCMKFNTQNSTNCANLQGNFTAAQQGYPNTVFSSIDKTSEQCSDSCYAFGNKTVPEYQTFVTCFDNCTVSTTDYPSYQNCTQNCTGTCQGNANCTAEYNKASTCLSSLTTQQCQTLNTILQDFYMGFNYSADTYACYQACDFAPASNTTSPWRNCTLDCRSPCINCPNNNSTDGFCSNDCQTNSCCTQTFCNFNCSESNSSNCSQDCFSNFCCTSNDLCVEECNATNFTNGTNSSFMCTDACSNHSCCEQTCNECSSNDCNSNCVSNACCNKGNSTTNAITISFTLIMFALICFFGLF